MPSVLPEIRSRNIIVNIQLKKLIKKYCPGNPWGIYEKIHQKTGLPLATIRALCTNRAKSVSIDALQKIVGFFASEFHISPAKLLGPFFGVQPSGFWRMFTSITSKYFKVQICQGVRHDQTTAEPKWINADDAFLTATFSRQVLTCYEQRPSDLEQCLLRSWSNKEHQKQCFNESLWIYSRFRQDTGSRALVCIGSMKTLPLSECVVAKVFGVKPFVSVPWNKIQNLQQMPLPIFFRYRKNDPHPPSAFGGRKFPLWASNGEAGIAYEVDDANWDFCPSSETQDAAMVFYVYSQPAETVEIALGGFSGRATGCIALELPDLANKIWPPQYQRSDLMVGAFIIRYEFSPSVERNVESHSILVKPTKTEVIPLSKEVLERRLGGNVGELKCEAGKSKTRGKGHLSIDQIYDHLGDGIMKCKHPVENSPSPRPR
jgi:hypothetical protein